MVRPQRHFKRALITGVSAAVAFAGLGVLMPSASQAATASEFNVVDRPTGAVTADPLPTTQIDGVVWDQAIVGDTVYAGGQFTNARPAGAAPGVNQTPRSNMLSFNIRTGVLDTGFKPVVNGRIRAMATSPDKKRLYVVGSFTQIDGKARNRVAAFNTADGSLINTFAPVAGSDVFTVTATNDAVYLGGWFTSMNGVARQKIAAVSASTGATLAWNPSADSTVNALALSPDKTRLIVGGIFSNLNGVFAPGLGSLDATTGALYPFAANNVIQNRGNSAGVQTLVSDGQNVYGSAYWFGGTGTFEGMFVADPYTGAIKSLADCHGDTYDASPMNGIVYTVSHHHYCSNIGGFPDTDPRNRWQRANAFTIDATSTVRTNGQGGYVDFAGQPAPSTVNWFPDVAAGSFTGQYQGGWTTEATSQYLVQGGEFPTVNNQQQQGLVRFAIPSLATNKQGPRATAADSAPTLRGISGNSVRVSWKSNFDRDDQNLTYKLYRSDKPTAPIKTTTVVSQFWNRPTQLFLDTGLKVGTTYGYWVVASDPDGNTSKSATTTITTGANVVDETAYSKQVQTDGAAHYWRLNEAAGEKQSVDWANGNDLNLGTGITNGVAGAITGSSDTASAFDGTANGTAASSTSEDSSDVFSAELWFKTSSTSGGKLLGFGGSQTGDSGSYDRHIYMNNAGKLTFGVYPGGVRTLTTADTFNNNEWHHVVATLSPAGMTLYVDGLLVGADAGTTSGQAYAGFWRVGGDNIGGWPETGSSNIFAGTIDDVAIYPTALSTAQVRDHFTKSGRTVDVPAVPSDAYGKQVRGDNPLLFWRLNDSASPVSDSSEGRNPGVVAGGVTFGSASTVAPGTAATFDGELGTIASTKSMGSPTTYSEEIWFNTTTNRGGKLMGFGDQQSGRSGNYDRHIYMEDSGQLTFGTYTGQLNTATSVASFNDGQWHHMVATQGSAGMKLYVDGAEVGSNAQTGAQGYTGFWRVGGDSAWGGSSSFFAGQLDEAAVYSYALSLDQVRAHYQASDAAANAAPVAAFTSSCTDGACYFDGSTSNDPDGSISEYAWDFGDGTTGTQVTASHTYAKSGTYTVSLTVKDNKNKTTIVSHDVVVTVNVAPVAAFTQSCDDLVCAFDGSSSADSDGTIASYAWNFGDGTQATGAEVNHTFTASGTFKVSLTVVDDKGSSKSITKDVTAKSNVKPTSSFTSSCANLVCEVDGSDSADSDGTIASYAWDFGDQGDAATVKATHTFAKAGKYTVTLTVTDDKGAKSTSEREITVQATNVSPTAAFTSTSKDLKATFDGTTSGDSDGTIASYAWKFGDGDTATGATPSHTYSKADKYEVTLTVTDNRGGTDSVTRTVSVTAPENVKPVAAFTSTSSQLELSVNGAGSTDADGTIASYAWDYGDGSTGSGKSDSHTYAKAGSFDVVLTVTDDAGATDSIKKTLTVTAPPAANIVAADDFSRTTARWGTATTGGAWSDSLAASFSTNGSKGVVTVSKAGSGPTATLSQVSALDTTAVVEFSVDKIATGSGFYVTLSSRKIGTSEYRLKARLMPDGTARLITAVVSGGTETAIKETVVSGLTYKAGDVLKMRFDVKGTGTATLSGKLWASSATEPAQATVTSTNSLAALQAPGAFALQGYLSGSSTSAPVVLTVDNLTITK